MNYSTTESLLVDFFRRTKRREANGSDVGRGKKSAHPIGGRRGASHFFRPSALLFIFSPLDFFRSDWAVGGVEGKDRFIRLE